MTRFTGWRAVAEALSMSGIGVVIGEPWDGMTARAAPSDLVDVLALAAERVGPTRVARHPRRGVVEIGHGPRTDASLAHDVDEAIGLVSAAARSNPFATHTITLDFELDAPLPGPSRQRAATPVATWGDADTETVAAIVSARAPLALVGPGVLLHGHAASLRTFAAAANIGVVNTWGAKGVFHWQSRHHLASIGLQADDFTLSGLDDADLLVTSGIDEREAPPARWSHVPRVDIGPSRLAPTSERLARGNDRIPMPPIRDRLARVTAAGWESTTLPVAASLLTRLYGEVAGGDGLVAADPGRAGFFVARTSGTTRPGGVLVPAEGDADGFAVAAVIASAMVTPWRRSIAVVDDPDEPTTSALLDLAERWSVPVTLDAWTADGRVIDADAHRDRLRAPVGACPTVERVAVDVRQLDDFIAAAGTPICWPTRPSWI